MNPQNGGLSLKVSFAGGIQGGLKYNTSTDPHPIVTRDVSFSQSALSATSIEAQLTLGGIVGLSVFYSTSGLAAFVPMRFALQADATTLPTGSYDWTMTITEHYADESTVVRTFDGQQKILNLTDSEFGSGWSSQAVDRLQVQSNGVNLVQGDGNMIWFTANTDGSYTRQVGPGQRLTLVQNTDSTYTLSAVGGDSRQFTSQGLLTSRTDQSGNVMTFEYVDADGDEVADELSQVTDTTGAVTTYAYTDGLLSSITDDAERVTTLSHDTNRRLTSITRPDPDGNGPLSAPVTSFTYDTATPD